MFCFLINLHVIVLIIMKKLLLTFLICFSANSSAISWLEVVGASDSAYIDVDNITKDSDFVFYSIMENMASMGLNSVITKSKADCKEKRVIELTKIYYGQAMGQGISYEEDNNDENEIYPKKDSTQYKIMKFACNQFK